MAVAPHVYNNMPKHLDNGDVVYLTDTIKCALLTAYTYAATHDTWADVLAAGTEVASSSVYTTRGTALGTKSITVASNVTKLNAANVVWTTAAGTSVSANFCVIYKDTGTNSTSYLIAMADFGGEQNASNGGLLTVDLSAGVASYTTS